MSLKLINLVRVFGIIISDPQTGENYNYLIQNHEFGFRKQHCN